MNEWNRMPDALKEQVFKHLERLAAVANLSEANRVAYDKAVDRFYVSRIYEEDMQNKVEDAMREGREKGMREGREKGMREGREEGMREGREEGKKEGKLEDAQNFKRLGVPADIIAKATGLSAEEIAKL
ncbi:hypothetical protein H6B13_16760 [Bacteroides gallinaceum]|nr:hypothetical protein [Bacteroides gallinaceum]